MPSGIVLRTPSLVAEHRALSYVQGTVVNVQVAVGACTKGSRHSGIAQAPYRGEDIPNGGELVQYHVGACAPRLLDANTFAW